jgi:hypothetical protein
MRLKMTAQKSRSIWGERLKKEKKFCKGIDLNGYLCYNPKQETFTCIYPDFNLFLKINLKICSKWKINAAK